MEIYQKLVIFVREMLQVKYFVRCVQVLTGKMQKDGGRKDEGDKSGSITSVDGVVHFTDS